jgi:hypothetical protein
LKFSNRSFLALSRPKSKVHRKQGIHPRLPVDREASYQVGKADRPVSSTGEGLLLIWLNNLPGKEAYRFGVDNAGFLGKPLL